MSSNTFVPGINNGSFDYDARFQRLMDVLCSMASELKGLRQEVTTLRQEIHDENSYRARSGREVTVIREPFDLPRTEPRPAVSASDQEFLSDVRF